MMHRIRRMLREASGLPDGAVPVPSIERPGREGIVCYAADLGRLSVAFEAAPLPSADGWMCSYSARIHGTPEHLSGREPFATALRVVGEWAAERRGLWVPPSE